MERSSKSEIVFRVFSYFFVTIFAILCLYPIIYAFSVSISGKLAYESGQIVFFPKDLQIEAYRIVLFDKGFWISYTNTLFYTIFGTAWSMFISLTGAYVLSKDKLLGKRTWNFLLVFTMWFSAGMIPLYLNYMELGVDPVKYRFLQKFICLCRKRQLPL